MKTVIAALLIACSIPATAGELVLHTLSYHSNHTYEDTWDYYKDGKYDHTTVTDVRYNNINPGIGYKFDSGLMFGYYNNSYHKPTFYVAQEYMFNQYVGVFGGLGTGYKYVSGRDINVLGGFVFKYQLTEKVGLNLMALPPIGNMTGVAHMAVSYKIGN